MLLLQATNHLEEAEALMERVLAIDEASCGHEHPNVATALNNLAQLLQATNRLTEAEPLIARAFAIFRTRLGTDHPNTQTVGGNYMILLQAMGLTNPKIQAKLHSLQPPN